MTLRTLPGTLDRMDLIINGEPRTVPEVPSLTALLAHLDIDPRRVAVEVNETVIKRARYDDTALTSRDRIEIVNFVGGG